MTGPAIPSQPGPPPALRVVHGAATDEEVAAVLAVLLATRAAQPRAGAGAAAGRSLWADRRSLLRAPLAAGPGGWRAAAAPR